ncbi:ATP-binding protein [Flavitalea sp.]|nr:ATP-binding protein [Flavitalea sp.]
MTSPQSIRPFVTMLRLLCSVFIIISPGSVPVFAQSIRTISTGDGLPQSFVSGLVQDDSSFIWIGTRNGIARFDGMQYKIFQHHSYDTQSLSSNVIIWMKKDPQNRIWIEHESGEIDMLNPVTEKITHLLKGNLPLDTSVVFVRRGWMVDSDGTFWGIIRSNGLNNYHPGRKKIVHFNRANSTLPGDTVRGIVETGKRQVWVVSQQAISQYDKNRNKFVNWPIPYQQDYGAFPESDAIAIDLHERANGELMWGDRNALYFFNPTTNQFRKSVIPSQGYMGIRWIRSGREQTEYLETYGKIYAYSDATGVTPVGNTNAHVFGDVKSFLVDRSGVIWMGTNAQGIRQIDLETPFFQVSRYKKDFATDMLMQEFGIDLQKQFNWTINDLIFTSPAYHLRTTYDHNRRLYFALKESVCYYDSIQKKVIALPRLSLANSPTETGIGIKGISIMPDGSPVIISFNGKIFAYNFSNSKWESLIDHNLLRKQFGALLLPQDIYVDQSYCWITTENDGLLKLELSTKKIQQFKEEPKVGSLPSNQLLGIRADAARKNIIWIGSYQGMISFNTQTQKCEVISFPENLPDNTIYSILDDQDGNLWLSSNRGITKFEPETKRVRVFVTRHGLPGDEFNRFHHLRLPNGDLVFGGTEGWIKFNALSMKEDEYDPVVAFTNLKINNRNVTAFDKDSDLNVPLNAMQRLVLPYEKNTLSIGFAGLEYTQPQDLLYRYKLEGYDKDWIVAGKERQANYTKIPPGSYTLLVNASNTTGKWSSFVKSVKLKINAPWWASWTAYLCYSIIIAGLVWTFIRFRVGRMLMEKEMILKEKETLQLKELDDMKSRFFSNITHEFRTPLTLILGPAEQLKTGKADTDKQHHLADTIVRNAKQLLVLINRLMDLSKLEAKAMKLHEQRGNPATVVGAVVHSFENDAEARQVDLSFTNDTGLTDCWFYPDAIERIVYNLVSNALKFTPVGGKVEVVLSVNPDQLQLSVTDTGVGIESQKLPYIFDRYYQASEFPDLAEETIDKGTGIGLAMVKELVDQMQGNIEVKSFVEAPSGTRFELLLPLRVAEATQISGTETGQHDGFVADTPPLENTAQILLVEDNRELAAFVMDIMRDHYHVNHVLNGAEGLELALSMMPDLIISDVMMPVMDGYEFTSAVKADIRTAHIPVILLTAKTAHEHLIEGLSRGADDYLTKPFHPTELLLRIQNQLTRQQKLRNRLREELGAHIPTDTASMVQQAEPIVEDVFLVKFYALLEEHIDDSLFGVDQLAGLMNISRSSLHRKLKALTDMSTTEVVRNYRLKKATRFLQEGFSSSETAYKSGFGSPAYFTKCFREVYGITPGDYIQKIKNTPVAKN